MNKHLRFGLLLFVVLLTCQAFGQQDAPQPEIPAARRQKLAKLIALTGVVPVAIDGLKAEMGNIKKLLPLPVKAQDDFASEMLAAITPETFANLVIPVYDKHLSDEDIDGLIAYYQSPLGQKMAKLLPQISAECRQVGEKWGSEMGRNIAAKIFRKVQAGEYGPWQPPTPAPLDKPKP